MVSKSNGPRPKKGRLGKKKRKLVEAHTLAHLRGARDYSHSHTRTREIDARVAAAGILGARIRHPRNHGVTVPVVPPVPAPRGVGPRAIRLVAGRGRRSLTIMGLGFRGMIVIDRGMKGAKGLRGANGYAGLDGLVGPIGPAGPQGPTGERGVRGNIEHEFRAHGRGTDTDMVVRSSDVYRRQAAPHVAPQPKPKPRPPAAPEPKPAAEPKPAPAPGPFQHGAFHGGAAPTPEPAKPNLNTGAVRHHPRENRGGKSNIKNLEPELLSNLPQTLRKERMIKRTSMLLCRIT